MNSDDKGMVITIGVIFGFFGVFIVCLTLFDIFKTPESEEVKTLIENGVEKEHAVCLVYYKQKECPKGEGKNEP